MELQAPDSVVWPDIGVCDESVSPPREQGPCISLLLSLILPQGRQDTGRLLAPSSPSKAPLQKPASVTLGLITELNIVLD